MRRFFVEDITEDSSSAVITGEELAHLRKVLRLSMGAQVSVFNGKGVEFTGTIVGIDKESASVELGARTQPRKESPVGVTLLQGIVKSSKPEFIIQKATELGAAAVFIYGTHRAVVSIGKEKSKDRVLRWKKVAVEAAKQCGRSIVPRVGFYADFEGAMASVAKGSFKVALWEGAAQGDAGSSPSLKDALIGARGKKDITVLIGPEGGLTDAEIEEARLKGFLVCGLGPRILRAETAAVAALAIVGYELGALE